MLESVARKQKAMMLIVGTVPSKDMLLTMGQVTLEGAYLVVNGQCFARM